MNNTAGAPILVPPTVPDTWCPSGSTWPEIVNEIFDKWLKATTVDIPGFGSLNLTELAQLALTVQQQGAQIAAITKEERSGFGEAVTLNGVTTVTFDAMPATSYRINLTIVDAGAAITAGDFNITEVPGSKQLTQFQFRSHNCPATFTVDWWIREL